MFVTDFTKPIDRYCSELMYLHDHDVKQCTFSPQGGPNAPLAIIIIFFIFLLLIIPLSKHSSVGIYCCKIVLSKLRMCRGHIAVGWWPRKPLKLMSSHRE